MRIVSRQVDEAALVLRRRHHAHEVRGRDVGHAVADRSPARDEHECGPRAPRDRLGAAEAGPLVADADLLLPRLGYALPAVRQRRVDLQAGHPEDLVAGARAEVA